MANDFKLLNEALGDIRDYPTTADNQRARANVGKAEFTPRSHEDQMAYFKNHYKNIRLSDTQIADIIACIYQGHEGAGFDKDHAHALANLLMDG